MSKSAISKSPAGATHELKDLEVFEVSLVDRPANKRPFLIVKKDPSMPKGQKLTTDGNGNLVSATKGSFGDDRKKKIKAALTGAVKTLSALAEAISDADDEESFMKRVTAVASSLGSMGGKPKGDGDDDKDAKKDEEGGGGETAPEDDFRTKALDAMESTIETALTPEPEVTPHQKATTERLDAMQSQLDQLTKAAATLTRVVKTSTGGTRPASQAAPTGEQPEVQKSAQDVWKLDMNSPDIDPDEQFT